MGVPKASAMRPRGTPSQTISPRFIAKWCIGSPHLESSLRRGRLPPQGLRLRLAPARRQKAYGEEKQGESDARPHAPDPTVHGFFSASRRLFTLLGPVPPRTVRIRAEFVRDTKSRTSSPIFREKERDSLRLRSFSPLPPS